MILITVGGFFFSEVIWGEWWIESTEDEVQQLFDEFYMNQHEIIFYYNQFFIVQQYQARGDNCRDMYANAPPEKPLKM